MAITAKSAASPWKFAVLADIRAETNSAYDPVASNTLEFFVQDIRNQGADFVIFPGDMIESSRHIMVYERQLYAWNQLMKPLYDAGIPVYVIRGDHEAGTNMSTKNDLWLSEFPVLKILPSPDGGFTYSFIHKNAKFVGFDQYINPQGQMMNSWVTNQIDDRTSPLNFAFGHKPLFPDTYGDNGQPRSSMSDDPESREALISALGAHHGAYFAGNDHLYLHADVSDGQRRTVPELIIGTAGRRNYNYSPEVASIYTRPESYTVDKVYSDPINPYFCYLLVTV